jgi:hypothetical protein
MFGSPEILPANPTRRASLPDGPKQAPFSDAERKMLRGRPTAYHSELAQTAIEDMSTGYSLGVFAG